MKNNKWTQAVDIEAFLIFSIQPLTHQQPPFFLFTPPPANSCGTNPSHMSWAGGRNQCGTSIPSFFPFSVYLNVKPFPTYYFYGCGRFALLECAHCCNSYCESDPLHWWNSIDRIPSLFQSHLIALWQLTVSIQRKSRITTHAMFDIWTPKYVYLRLRKIFSVVKTSREL